MTPTAPEVMRRLERAEWFIEKEGYRRCDIPACNCPYWHGGNASSRLREVQYALRDADVPWQGTIQKTLEYALKSFKRDDESALSDPDKWAQQNPEAWEALRTGRAGVYEIVESDCWYDGKVPLIGSRIDMPFKSEVKETK